MDMDEYWRKHHASAAPNMEQGAEVWLWGYAYRVRGIIQENLITRHGTHNQPTLLLLERALDIEDSEEDALLERGE